MNEPLLPELPPPEPKNWFARQWHDHGTKIMGIGIALAGMTEYIDAQTLNLVGGAMGPKWGPIVSKAIQVMAGLMIAKRGYTNSQRR